MEIIKKETIRNFDNEIAWKERQKKLEEEKKFEEILEEERMKSTRIQKIKKKL